jgi:hypothetical protein
LQLARRDAESLARIVAEAGEPEGVVSFAGEELAGLAAERKPAHRLAAPEVAQVGIELGVGER